ncbi:MAG: TrbG/VirB9 family P-type conjugative transfer protein [Leptospirillia bacterium]
MNRTFWAGFGVAVVVILLPVLVLIDARSSSEKKPPAMSAPLPSKPEPALPPEAETLSLPPPPEGDQTSPTFTPPPSGRRRTSGNIVPKDLSDPVIAFSPPRIREGVERELRRREREVLRKKKHSGIRTIVYDPNHVYTLRTAVSHVTLVDFPEEAKEVYLGDSKLFMAEVFGSRVKIKPITWDHETTTNMIVYTLHRQFAFRLRVVAEGEEDDLLTFYLPQSDTVVNLNPLRKKMEADLAVREKADLRKTAIETLREAGPQVPVGVRQEEGGIGANFLGFSSLGNVSYALFEITNETGRPAVLQDVRLRSFRTSLFWEGRKNYIEGQDYSQSYQVTVLPHAKKRILLPADPPPLASSRDGYLAEVRVDVQEGGRRVFRLEKRGYKK